MTTTIDQCIVSLGYSPNTSAMLLNIVTDYTTEMLLKWDVLDGIKAVIDNKPQDFGDEFAARVWEALSFTPDPFNRGG